MTKIAFNRNVPDAPTAFVCKELPLSSPAKKTYVIPLPDELKGGAGSGNFGHAGRPGQRGGSAPGGGRGATYVQGRELTIDDLPGTATWYNTGETNPAFQVYQESENTRSDPVLAEILKTQGFDGLPDTASSAELDALIADGSHTELFRGVGSNDQVKQFQSGDLFVGRGVYGNGTYTTTSRSDAENYVTGDSRPFRMALRPNARVATYNDISDMAGRMRGTLPERSRLISEAWKAGAAGDMEKAKSLLDKHYSLSRKEHSRNELTMDDGRMAALVGYDAIKVQGTTDYSYYIILNRTAVIVERWNP